MFFYRAEKRIITYRYVILRKCMAPSVMDHHLILFCCAFLRGRVRVSFFIVAGEHGAGLGGGDG